MRMETPISRVRGLGSAHHGAHDWWMVRINSVSTLLLLVWLGVSLLRLPSFDHGTVVQWLGHPVSAVAMLLLIASGFWHLKFGVREWIDDYVHDEGWRVVSLGALYAFVVGLGALGAFSVLRIAFGGEIG